MKSFYWSFFLMFLLMGCASESPPKTQENRHAPDRAAKVRVLSTISMINELVKPIGGEHIEASILIPSELDPHSYQLVKGDDEKLRSAQIIFYNGLELEHGPSLKQYLQKSAKTIPLGNKIFEQHPDLILNEKGQLDPHIWMDISLWAKAIPFIVEKLAEADPLHADFFHEQGAILQKNLLAAHDAIHSELMQIPSSQRFLVTSHDAFNYFTKAYLAEESERTAGTWRHRFAAPEGLAPDSQLSVADIQYVISHLKKYQIHVLFPESNVSKDSIRKIVYAGQENGLNLQIAQVSLYGDSMGPPGSDGDSYLKMIQHNARTIANYLQSSQPSLPLTIQEACRVP